MINAYLFVLVIILSLESSLAQKKSDSYSKDIYQKLLIKADKLYAERKDVNQAKKALEAFKQYNRNAPKDPAGLWRMSMAYYYIGHLLPGRKNRLNRKNYFSKGIEAGQSCVKYSLRPKVECFFWQGTNLALLEQERGLVSLAFGLNEVIDLLEKAKKIDPHYASAGAYRTLSIIYHRAPRFLGGDSEKSEKYIKKSMTLFPNEPLNIIFYAKYLIDRDQQAKAKKVIQLFLKKANPKRFSFLESKSSFTELKYYAEYGSWPEP